MKESAFSSCSFPLTFSQKVKFLVNEGDKILKDMVLAVEEEEIIEEFNLAAFFSVSPNIVSRFLTVSIGERVEEGRIIAVKKGLFGRAKVFKSPVKGTVVNISKEGILTIKIGFEKKEFLSPFPGVVKEIKENSLVLEFNGKRIEGSFGKGKKVLGVLDILSKKEEKAGIFSLGSEAKDKILVLEGEIPLGIIYKAEALGVAGLVGGRFPQEVEVDEIAIVSFGDENGKIDQEIWQEIEKRKGEESLLSGEERFLLFPLEP